MDREAIIGALHKADRRMEVRAGLLGQFADAIVALSAASLTAARAEGYREACGRSCGCIDGTKIDDPEFEP